ncbi:MAG: hypothetical protein ACO3DQ_01715 [Cephaloticoccus sp.]
MPPVSSLPAPDFRLRAAAGRLQHLEHHRHRPFEAASLGARGDTITFNGQDSRLRYAVSDWPELALTGAWTLHVRARFAASEAETYVAGRHGLNFLTVPTGYPQGNFSHAPQSLTPVNSRAWCDPARWHDVFLRFLPGSATTRARTEIEVRNSKTGEMIGRSHPLPRFFDEMRFARGDAPFTLGQTGAYRSWAGELAELSIWNRWLDLPAAPFARPSARPALSIAPRTDLLDPNASARWDRWRQSRTTFPLAAWGYFHRYAATFEEYATYRAAGLTLVMAPLGSAEHAEAAGLDPVLGLWQDDGHYAELYCHPDRLGAHLAFARAKLNRCAGYMLADEPRFGGPCIAELAPGFREIYARDDQALPMVNLMTYPYTMGGGFGRYVEDVIRANHPPFLVADSYVLFADGSSNDDQFYANTEVVRQKARQAGIGFMGFALVTGHRRRFPEHGFRTASESDLQWQVNTLLAYGAHGIWYYNYRIGGEGFDEALVTHTGGVPAPIYARVRSLNESILAQSSLILALTSTGVWHVRGDEDCLPEYACPYADGVIGGLTALEGTGLVIGEFTHDAEPNARYLMVVNKRHAADATVDDTTLATTVTLRFVSDSVATIVDARASDLALGPCPVLTLRLGGGERALVRVASA